MRKIAMFTCIASAWSLVTPMSRLVAVIRHLPPVGIWADILFVSTTSVVSLMSGVVLLFYFALYRDRGTLHASAKLRLVCRAAAFLLGIISAADLPTQSSALAINWANAMDLDWRSG